MRTIARHQLGFCVRRGDVQTWSCILQKNFSNKWKLCALKPARTQNPKTLPVCHFYHCQTEVFFGNASFI